MIAWYTIEFPIEFSDSLITQIRKHAGNLFAVDYYFFSFWHLQTGLSGSSAIICAALNCLLDFYQIRHLVSVEIRPQLILSAENELGIVAGLQDRVAQVYGGLVYMVLRFIRRLQPFVISPPFSEKVNDS